MKILQKYWWLPLIIIISLVTFELYVFYKRGFKPLNDADTEKRLFVVQYGDSLSKVAKRLEKEGFIYSELIFRIISRQNNADFHIKPGEYLFSPSQKPAEILDDLVKGRFLAHNILIPEGFDIFDIAQKIEEAGLDTAENFIRLSQDASFIQSLGINATSVEGYLFPATYRFPVGAKSDYIIKQMTTNFFKNLNRDEELSRLLNDKKEINKILTIASIVEKETAIDEEKPIIAGIFYKRMELDMPLQADPTVIYGLKIENKWDKDISKEDLRTTNEYNTYKIKGLPKTPICNPGLSSIKAAVNPKITDYLYFVSKNDNSHQFSQTLAQHNRAVNKYQRKNSSNKNTKDLGDNLTSTELAEKINKNDMEKVAQ